MLPYAVLFFIFIILPVGMAIFIRLWMISMKSISAGDLKEPWSISESLFSRTPSLITA